MKREVFRGYREGIHERGGVLEEGELRRLEERERLGGGKGV